MNNKDLFFFYSIFFLSVFSPFSLTIYELKFNVMTINIIIALYI